MRIERLEIKSLNFEDQLKFYRDLMGLKIKNSNLETFEVVIGYSLLEFTKSENATPYHIAIHIPDKQEEKALEWIKERVPVLRNNTDEIIDFSAWDAKSLYFYDADKNIMEFISRRSFSAPKVDMFSEKSLVGIAEIGMATNDIMEKFQFLNNQCLLEKFDGDFEKFCAIGDDEGLIITINKNKKTWFPTQDIASLSDFKISFNHLGNQHRLVFENDDITKNEK